MSRSELKFRKLAAIISVSLLFSSAAPLLLSSGGVAEENYDSVLVTNVGGGPDDGLWNYFAFGNTSLRSPDGRELEFRVSGETSLLETSSLREGRVTVYLSTEEGQAFFLTLGYFTEFDDLNGNLQFDSFDRVIGYVIPRVSMIEPLTLRGILPTLEEQELPVRWDHRYTAKTGIWASSLTDAVASGLAGVSMTLVLNGGVNLTTKLDVFFVKTQFKGIDVAPYTAVLSFVVVNYPFKAEDSMLALPFHILYSFNVTESGDTLVARAGSMSQERDTVVVTFLRTAYVNGIPYNISWGRGQDALAYPQGSEVIQYVTLALLSQDAPYGIPLWAFIPVAGGIGGVVAVWAYRKKKADNSKQGK